MALYHQIFIFGINIVVAELLFVIIELSCSVESVIKQSTNDLEKQEGEPYAVTIF